MRNIFILLCVVAFSTTLFAGNASHFSYDKEAINSEFANLTQVENFVKSNANITLSEIKTNSEMYGLNTNNLVASSASSSFFDDMDWGAFAWGCLCCPIGLFVVVLDKDSTPEQKSSFWKGVLVSVGVNTIYNIIVLSSGTTTTTY